MEAHDDVIAPRTLEEVRADLGRLRDVKQAFAGLAAPDFGAEVSLLSVEARESELLAEESAALLVEEGGDAEIVLSGDAVTENSVQAGFLADMLGSLQRLVDAVAQARAGESTPRGAVRGEIRESVRLMVAGFSAGSFAVRLTMPPQPGQLFGPGVLESTASLFSPDPDVGEFLTLMRLDRVRSGYQDMMNSLVRHRSSIAVASRGLSHSIAFTSRMAKERLDWMELIEVNEQPKLVSGILVGGDVEKRTYHLAVDDEEFTGKVLDKAVGELKSVKLGSRVEAGLLVITKAQVDNVLPSRTIYYLESIRPHPREQQMPLNPA